MKKMILVSPWTLPTVGGTQRLVHCIANEFVRNKYDVTVVTAHYGSEMHGVVRQRTTMLYNIIRLETEQNNRFNNHYGMSEGFILKNLQSVFKNIMPDYVLYTPHVHPLAYQCIKEARKVMAKTILWPAIHLDNSQHVSDEAIKLYREADLLISNSELESDFLKKNSIDGSKVVTAGCGIESNWKIRKQKEIGEEIKFLSVGQIRKHKNFIDQIECIRILRNKYNINCALKIIGANVGQNKHITDFIKNSKLEKYIYILENAIQEEIYEGYDNADVFFFTSSSESFGIAVLEAICCGLYPIVYSEYVYSEIVKTSGFGTVCQYNTPEDLALMAMNVIENNQQRQKVVSFEWIENFHWEKIADKILKVMESI